MTRATLSLAAALLLLPLSLSAGTGEAALNAFLAGLKTMRAPFIQSLLDADDKLKEESRGELLLSRPGRFRLAYHAPYEQLYVADGERVWMFDRELEQVTVKLQGEALQGTPAVLLSGETPLRDDFTISELGNHEGYDWLELKPKREDSGFAWMRIAMEENTLAAMEMVDSFGQTTRLFFTGMERNPVLDEAQFRFTPPPGVDVIGGGE